MYFAKSELMIKRKKAYKPVHCITTPEVTHRKSHTGN